MHRQRNAALVAFRTGRRSADISPHVRPFDMILATDRITLWRQRLRQLINVMANLVARGLRATSPHTTSQLLGTLRVGRR